MPMALWEGFEVENSTDSVWFKCTQNQVVGEEVQCFSHNGEYPFTYELPVNMTYDTVNPDLSDSLLVPDPVMAKLFLPNASGSKHNIFVTFDALQFNKVADWYQIASITGTPTSMVVSVDGDVLFIGTKQGKLFRISNLKAVVDANTANTTTAITAEIALPTTQCITSIAISDEDNSKVVVTLGSYGNDTYVLYSDNAMDDDAVFEARQGKHLPKMPVYSSVYTVYKYTNKEGQLVKEDHVLIGTEHGVYRTTNIGSSLPEWTAEMKMMGDVPVLDMKQQKVLKEDQKVIINGVETIFPGVRNHGIIYAATYGRGLFRCETYHTFYAPQDVNETPAPTNKSKLVMYPNPVRDAAKVSFELNSNTSVSYQVFDINGRMVKVENAGNYSAGKHEINVSVDGLAKGTYVLRLNAGSQSSSVKFMVF